MFRLHESLGDAIVSHLKAIDDLPSEGYLAGQAVCSALFDLYSEDPVGMIIYNDLDIFRQATYADHIEAEESDRTIKTVEYQGYHIQADYRHLSLQTDSHYTVIRSYRDRFVNQVAIDGLGWQSRNGRALSPLQVLIQSFDLNCTQVGVDLSTGRLEWSPAFEAFIRSRQLEISNVQTPHHTIMRYFKKRQEMPGLFGNDQHALELVSLVSIAKAPKKSTRYFEQDHLRWRFGEKSSRLYRRHRSELAPYFHLLEDQDNPDIFLLETRQTPDPDLVMLARRYPARVLPFVFYALHQPRKLAQSRRFEYLLSQACGHGRTVQICLGSLLAQGEPYLAGNVAVSSLRTVDAFIQQYPIFGATFLDLPARAQIEEHKRWIALAGRHGKAIIFGYAEGLLRHGLQSLRASDCEAAFLEEETYHLGEDVVLTRGRRFEARINGFHCLELVTKAELLDESNAMHHCVAGYASFVRSGQSRIVRIRHPDKRLWSTAELVPGDGQWCLTQNRSFCNDPPAEPNKKLMQALVRSLNSPDDEIPAVAASQVMPSAQHPGTMTPTPQPFWQRFMDWLLRQASPNGSKVEPGLP